MNLDSKIPDGPLSEKWSSHKFKMKLVNPANRRKYSVIVVGSGLAGGAAAASLAEQGYNVSCFCYQDSPRRAHSIAAQGGINARRITKTTVTVFIDFFMIQSKAATIARVRPTFIAYPRCLQTSSTNVLRMVCPLLVNTVVC